SFKALDNYFATHMQQIRIVDFLARDVRRGLSVTSSFDQQTVTINIPEYIIQAGDPDSTASNIGTPRAPTRAIENKEYNIKYDVKKLQLRHRSRTRNSSERRKQPWESIATE